MTNQEKLRKLIALATREHYTCDEDNWYACPTSGECLNDNLKGTPCNCGADKHNAIVKTLSAELLREFL